MTSHVPFITRLNQALRNYVVRTLTCVFAGTLLTVSTHGQDAPEPAISGPDVEVFDYEFSSSSGNLIYFDRERLVLAVGGVTSRTFNPDDIAFVRIEPIENSNPTKKGSHTGRLWLTDGSHYSTKPLFRRGNLIWKNEMIGQIEAPLDQIIAFNRSSITFPDSSQNDDLVVLENGDQIEGLVDRIDEKLFIEQVDGSMDGIPLERVDSFALINDRTPDTGARLWSVGGDKIAFDSFRYEQGLGLIFDERRIHVPTLPGQVTAFTYNIERITPLADLPVETSGIPGQLRYHTPAPVNQGGVWPLDASPILISGPIRLEWDLPRSGLGLIASAVLPSECRKYGSVELVISDKSGVLLRQVLTRDEPLCDIRIQIRGRQLTLELHDNGDGPLQDSIRLDQAILLDKSITN